MIEKRINLPKLIGKGYGTYWRDKQHKYMVCKGSRASKKSKTTAYWIIYNMMKYPLANTLVVRQTFATLKDSCWTDLQWACDKLGVSDLWKFTKSPLEATYIPTGQKILFRGLDNALKVTSITVKIGYLCWVWFEEAYEIEDQEAFNKVEGSIRAIPKESGLWQRFMITFNPWSEHHWLKKRFFDNENNDERIYAFTTNHLCNEWLTDEDRQHYEIMKKNNPKRYQVEGLGNWGITDGLIFENFRVESFDIDNILEEKKNNKIQCYYGSDFGYNDPFTIISCALDDTEKKIYIFDEFYKSYMTEDDMVKKIKELKMDNLIITADSATPELIACMKKKGIRRITPCKKGADSVLAGIQFLMNYEIIIHPKCKHIEMEFNNYCWDKDKKTGESIDKPIDKWNHCIDALRYAVEELTRKNKNNGKFIKMDIR